MEAESQIHLKLRKINALFAGATTEGEKQAAGAARDRIHARLRILSGEPTIEWRFSLTNPWSRKLLIALLHRYGIESYRRLGQRNSSIMAKMRRGFAEQILLPEFESLNRVLLDRLDELAE